MRVVIEALGIRAGGGGVILNDVLAELDTYPENCITLVTSSPADFAGGLPDRVKCWVLPGGSWLPWRVFWAQFLARWCKPIRRADVLLTLSGLTMTTSTLTIAYVQNALPFVAAPPGVLPTKMRTRFWVLRRVMGRVMTRAARVVVQTQWMADHLQGTPLCPSSGKTVVVRPSIPCHILPGHAAEAGSRIEAPPRVVLYVGSSLPHKNLDTLKAAWKRVLSLLGSQVELWVTASEQSYGAVQGVRCLGEIDRGELCAIYERATLLVQPSLIETLGLPLLEGMAHGLPVVAADLPYAREVLSDGGLFFNPLDAKELSARILHVLDSPTRSQQLSDAGRHRVQEWQRMANTVTISEVIMALKYGKQEVLSDDDRQRARKGSE